MTITLLKDHAINPEHLERSDGVWPTERNAKWFKKGDVVTLENGRAAQCLINTGVAVKGAVPISELPDSNPRASVYREKSVYDRFQENSAYERCQDDISRLFLDKAAPKLSPDEDAEYRMKNAQLLLADRRNR